MLYIPFLSFFTSDPRPIDFFSQSHGVSPDPKSKKNAIRHWWSPLHTVRATLWESFAEGKKLAAMIAKEFAQCTPRRIPMPLLWALLLNVPIFLYITTTDWYAQLSEGIHWKHHGVDRPPHLDGTALSIGTAKEVLGSVPSSPANPMPAPLSLPMAIDAGKIPKPPTQLAKPVAPVARSRTANLVPPQSSAKQQEAVTYFQAPLKIDGASFAAPPDPIGLPKGTPGNSTPAKSEKATGSSSLSPLGTSQ